MNCLIITLSKVLIILAHQVVAIESTENRSELERQVASRTEVCTQSRLEVHSTSLTNSTFNASSDRLCKAHCA